MNTSFINRRKLNQMRTVALQSFVAVALYVPLAVLSSSPFVAALFAVFITTGLIWFQRTRMRDLIKRIRANDGSRWDVYLNSVCAGTILDSDYAAMRITALRDVSLYFLQLLNIAEAALRMISHCVRSIPVMVFWGLLAVAFFSPETVPQTIRAFSDAPPELVHQGVLSLTTPLLVLAILSVAFSYAFGTADFGFKDVFGETIRADVRIHLNLHADGVLWLEKQAERAQMPDDRLPGVYLSS